MPLHYEVSCDKNPHHLLVAICSSPEQALMHIEIFTGEILEPPAEDLRALMSQLRKLDLKDTNLSLDIEGTVKLRVLTEEEYEKWQRAF